MSHYFLDVQYIFKFVSEIAYKMTSEARRQSDYKQEEALDNLKQEPGDDEEDPLAQEPVVWIQILLVGYQVSWK